jgi:hypothetical protein
VRVFTSKTSTNSPSTSTPMSIKIQHGAHCVPQRVVRTYCSQRGSTSRNYGRWIYVVTSESTSIQCERACGRA